MECVKGNVLVVDKNPFSVLVEWDKQLKEIMEKDPGQAVEDLRAWGSHPGSCCRLKGLEGLKKPVALGGQVEVILPGDGALGDPERLFQGYLLFLWEVPSFSLA